MAVVNKIKSTVATMTDNVVTHTAKETVQQVWWAGLGALAKAQENSNKIFEELVKEGEAVQAKNQKKVEGKVSAGANKAAEAWSKVEQVFTNRVAQVLALLSVPSRNEINELSERVAELAKLVKELNASAAKSEVKAEAKPAAEAKPVEAKVATKPAAAKTTVAK